MNEPEISAECLTVLRRLHTDRLTWKAAEARFDCLSRLAQQGLVEKTMSAQLGYHRGKANPMCSLTSKGEQILKSR